MKSSKLTSKCQATVPKEIRKVLKIKAGDSIIFEITEDGAVIIRKASPLDVKYLKALNKTLSEWESEYDEKDFEHLQDI